MNKTKATSLKNKIDASLAILIKEKKNENKIHNEKDTRNDKFKK